MTIIETIIATAVLVFGLVGVASLLVYGVRSNLDNRQRTVATFLIQQKLEEIKTLSWDEAAWNPGIYEEVLNPIGGQRYTRSWQIDGSDLRTVTIIIYAERNGRPVELVRAASTIAAPF